MKVNLDIKNRYCEVTKEQGDPKFYSGGWGTGTASGGTQAESKFLYRVLQELKKQGYDVIKKRMWKDGHMVSDEQQYIRERKEAFAIYNNMYAIYDMGEEFNKLDVGESITLAVSQ